MGRCATAGGRGWILPNHSPLGTPSDGRSGHSSGTSSSIPCFQTHLSQSPALQASMDGSGMCGGTQQVAAYATGCPNTPARNIGLACAIAGYPSPTGGGGRPEWCLCRMWGTERGRLVVGYLVRGVGLRAREKGFKLQNEHKLTQAQQGGPEASARHYVAQPSPRYVPSRTATRGRRWRRQMCATTAVPARLLPEDMRQICGDRWMRRENEPPPRHQSVAPTTAGLWRVFSGGASSSEAVNATPRPAAGLAQSPAT